MSDSKLIGLVVAAAVAVALILFGINHFRKPPTEPKPQAEQGQQAPEAPKSGEAAPSKSAAQVPSFDVVRVEGTGEGVIAGRAAPGWTVRVESNGQTIAETKTDDEGAWTVVLDKPLPSGDNALSLTAISPDGTSSLTAQQPVKVAVGEGSAVAAAEPEKPAEPSADQEPARPTPVRFKDVQYQETGPDGGKLTMSGTGAAGASILLYLDNEALGQVTIGPDGNWSFEADTKVDGADHTLRADLIEAGTGVVAGRTAAAFRRAQEAVASSQPQPVYPDGSPPPPTPPSPPVAAAPAEPVGVANQPQPVYPEGTSQAAAPAASTSVAEAGSSLASQPQPVYPEGAPGKETTGTASQPEPVSREAPVETAIAGASAPVSPQPQPVYPEGLPPPATTPAPSASTVPAEPATTANQPQPVYPSETAAAEPEPSTPAVTAETPGETPRVHTKPTVAFKSVDYHDVGAGSGKVALSGTGDPGARIRLYFDDAPLGEVTVESDGNWSFGVEKKLEMGEHNLRADRIEEGTGVVIGRASIGMARMEPPAAEKEVAAQAPEPSAPAAATPQSPPEREAAATEDAQPAPVVKTQARRQRPRVYTVRRGDTLWEIAEYYYGGGWRYRAIVRDNRRKIKNPHWIYPRQKFSMPRRG